LREEYFLLTRKKPYMWRPESLLEVKVAELKSQWEVKWRALDTKKSEWGRR
jgi:hypothetical protein